ncbi:TPA: hypothetical protein OUB96_005499 [Klebsiella pneumoniae]|nr:hypothetical protein [Klebsiella pneumoniae]
MTTDITILVQRLKVAAKNGCCHTLFPDDCQALVEALEKAQQRISQLESRTVKLPDGWQFEECEIEGCENGAIFSVGTGSRNIHLCDKCAHEPQNSRLNKSPLSKRLPFKMSAGIKVEAE